MAKSNQLRSQQDEPMGNISTAGPPLPPVATEIPRKNFLRMLLAGSALLPLFNKTAKAQLPHTEIRGRLSPNLTYGATKVMIIRHAEKPVGQINGIDESGNQDSNSLIPQGWQRPGALIPPRISLPRICLTRRLANVHSKRSLHLRQRSESRLTRYRTVPRLDSMMRPTMPPWFPPPWPVLE